MEHDNQLITGKPSVPTALLSCPGGRRPRLLLAEDSSTARILTAALLKRMGAEVDAVEDGEEALRQIRENPYDLVLLDIEMPVLDGVSAARQIRALEGIAAKTPLMVLSAFLADSAKCGSWREFFDHALPKPAGRAELHSAIQFVLNTRSHRPSGTAAAAPAPGADVLIDRDVLVEAEAQSEAGTWRELVGVAIHEIHGCTRQMSEAITAGDRQAFRRQAHKLKGIARSFGAPKLAAAAELLELDSETSSIKHLADQSVNLRRLANRSTAALAAISGH
jgi:CheY-like chemotaxis protein/HPt (histidine-containing phosphotransfer) domain-containing protein